MVAGKAKVALVGDEPDRYHYDLRSDGDQSTL